MTNMKIFSLICIGLALALAPATTAAEPYEPWPTKDQLSSIDQAAYACSRDNSTQAWTLVRHSLPTADGSPQVARAL